MERAQARATLISRVSNIGPVRRRAQHAPDDDELDVNELVEDCCYELSLVQPPGRVRCRLNAVRRRAAADPRLLRSALLDTALELLEDDATELMIATDNVTLTAVDDVRTFGTTLVGPCLRVTIASGSRDQSQTETWGLTTTRGGLGSMGAALQCCRGGIGCRVVFGLCNLIQLYLPVASGTPWPHEG